MIFAKALGFFLWELLFSSAGYLEISCPGTAMLVGETMKKAVSILSCIPELFAISFLCCGHLDCFNRQTLFQSLNICFSFGFRIHALISAKFSFQRWLLIRQTMTLKKH